MHWKPVSLGILSGRSQGGGVHSHIQMCTIIAKSGNAVSDIIYRNQHLIADSAFSYSCVRYSSYKRWYTVCLKWSYSWDKVLALPGMLTVTNQDVFSTETWRAASRTMPIRSSLVYHKHIILCDVYVVYTTSVYRNVAFFWEVQPGSRDASFSCVQWPIVPSLWSFNI